MSKKLEDRALELADEFEELITRLTNQGASLKDIERFFLVVNQMTLLDKLIKFAPKD